MNVNFGLMPPLAGRAEGADRKQAYTDRARVALADGSSAMKAREPA